MRRRRTWWVETCESERGAKVFWLPAGMSGPRGRLQPRRLWGPYLTGPAADRAALTLQGAGWTVQTHDTATMGPTPTPAKPAGEFWGRSPRSQLPKPAQGPVTFDALATDANPSEQRRDARLLRLALLARRPASKTWRLTEPEGDRETVAGATITIADDGRVYVRFPHYLSTGQYARVYESGFRWSKSRHAFARKHSDAALHAARTIAHDVKGIP